ncbi:hypothetical protein OG322_35390 [Streptomyces sp. NBC_01260]|uniref:hypothetical protein n=1 Tax=unclassified Streptomyces TaxID=2593676 RepID=UPI000F4AC109|nr:MULTISPECIES: hypothetical protein [unclassified Streptomyces]
MGDVDEVGVIFVGRLFLQPGDRLGQCAVVVKDSLVERGVADEFGPPDVDRGGAQGLAVGGLAGLSVLVGFAASGEVGRGGAFGLALEPVQVAQYTLVAAFPAEVLCGGEGGGEVAGQAGGMGKAAAGGRGQASVLIGDVLVVAPGFGGPSGVAQGIGPPEPVQQDVGMTNR